MKDMSVLPDVTVKQAMKKLNKSGEKCLVVVDENQRLLGTLSDGDVRKAILKGVSFGDSIAEIFQPKPTFLVEGNFDLNDAKRLFIEHKFDIIPVVGQDDKVVRIMYWGEVFQNGEIQPPQKLVIPVVIMAGGKGTRLEPFTKVLPKPLVPIHEKPIIEHIIERFTDVGVNEFILTVNYKTRIMKAYFEELQPDYSINFVEEQEPLGTAGSLKYLAKRIDKPFMVTNCDILIKADYLDLYTFHQNNKFDITLVASLKNYTIPYGTVELNGEGDLKQINEKPEYDFLVNTGLYVLDPGILQLIPDNGPYHITHLIEDAKSNGKRVGVYPIDEDAWIDVGQWAEYQKAVDRL